VRSTCVQSKAELEALQLELRAWERVDNTIRPHQALGYLTPAEYLERWADGPRPDRHRARRPVATPPAVAEPTRSRRLS